MSGPRLCAFLPVQAAPAWLRQRLRRLDAEALRAAWKDLWLTQDVSRPALQAFTERRRDTPLVPNPSAGRLS